MKGTATELNNAEVILQIIFSHFDFWIVSTEDFTTVSITIWTASIQFLYTESEEYNYLVENGYDTEHSVTPMAKGILFSWLFSVSAPLVKMKEKFPPCISVKKKRKQKNYSLQKLKQKLNIPFKIRHWPKYNFPTPRHFWSTQMLLCLPGRGGRRVLHQSLCTPISSDRSVEKGFIHYLFVTTSNNRIIVLTFEEGILLSRQKSAMNNTAVFCLG